MMRFILMPAQLAAVCFFSLFVILVFLPCVGLEAFLKWLLPVAKSASNWAMAAAERMHKNINSVETLMENMRRNNET
jgi:hypothetical protein